MPLIKGNKFYICLTKRLREASLTSSNIDKELRYPTKYLDLKKKNKVTRSVHFVIEE